MLCANGTAAYSVWCAADGSRREKKSREEMKTRCLCKTAKQP